MTDTAIDPQQTQPLPRREIKNLRPAENPWKSGFDLFTISTTVILLSMLGKWILKRLTYANIWSPAFVVLSIACSDFFSGLVHWMTDSYGSIDAPIIGRLLIRPFREHHLDPCAMTRYSWIYTNGDNFTITLPFLMLIVSRLHRLNSDPGNTDKQYFNLMVFLFALAVYVCLTNQIHKWSHTHVGLPWPVTALQRMHLILPRGHHHYHHIAPHDTYFCISTGWLNWPLQRLRFFTTAESLIERWLRVKARTDDLSWAAEMREAIGSQ